MLVAELCVQDAEADKFNAFAQILISEFAYMRSKTAEDMELMRRRFPLAANALQSKRHGEQQERQESRVPEKQGAYARKTKQAKDEELP